MVDLDSYLPVAIKFYATVGTVYTHRLIPDNVPTVGIRGVAC